jgi:hypothetical protein
VNSIDASRRALVALNHGARAALHWDAFDNYHEHDQAMTHYGLLRNGGPDRIWVALPEERAPQSWTLYATTASLDCANLGPVPVRGGIAELGLPGKAVFTLVGAQSR